MPKEVCFDPSPRTSPTEGLTRFRAAFLLRAALLVAILGVATPPAALLGQSQAATFIQPRAAEEVIVRPGDMLRIGVWPDQSLGGEFPVEESGYAYLPILGQVEAGNVSLTELRARLRDGYATAMKNPVVTVTPLFRVSVLGAVPRPGLYSVDPTHSLFDVISMAGGFRPDADERRIVLVRETGTTEINAQQMMMDGGGGVDLTPRSGDRIVVPAAKPRTMWRNVLTALNTAALVATIVYRINR